MLEQIVLVYRTLSECPLAACSTGSARTQKNRADRICQCWRVARPDRCGQYVAVNRFKLTVERERKTGNIVARATN